MEKKPFERCGVRCSLSPSSANTACRIGGQDLLGGLALVQGEQDGDQPAHDVGVAVALELKHRGARRGPPGASSSPARPGWRSRAPCWRRCAAPSGSGGRRAPQLDHVAVAVLPVVEQGEIGADGVERHGTVRPSLLQPCDHGRPRAPSPILCIWSRGGRDASRAGKSSGRPAVRCRRAAPGPRQAGVQIGGRQRAARAGGCSLGSGLPLAARRLGCARAALVLVLAPPELARSMAMRAPNSAFLRNVAHTSAPAAQVLRVAVAEGGGALDRGRRGAVEARLLALVGRQQQHDEAEPERHPDEEHGTTPTCSFIASAVSAAVVIRTNRQTSRSRKDTPSDAAKSCIEF